MLRCAPQGPAGCPRAACRGCRTPTGGRLAAGWGRYLFMAIIVTFCLLFAALAAGEPGAGLGGRGPARTPRAAGPARRRREQVSAGSRAAPPFPLRRRVHRLRPRAGGRAEPSASGKGELAAVGTPPVGNGPARVPVVSWREGAVPSPRDGDFGGRVSPSSHRGTYITTYISTEYIPLSLRLCLVFLVSLSQRPGLGCPFVLTRWVFLGMWLGKLRFWGPYRTSLAVHDFP